MIGRMKQQITLLEKLYTDDLGGGYDTSYLFIDKIWAELTPLDDVKVKEDQQHHRLQRYTARFRQYDITEEMVAEYQGRYFKIDDVNHSDARQKYMTLQLREIKEGV